MTDRIDDLTGLPELPEGYFWRVRPGSFRMDRLELRKRVWFFSVEEDSRILPFYGGNREPLDPGETILVHAKSIMKEFHNPWGSYYGDYPPKTLKGKP